MKEAVVANVACVLDASEEKLGREVSMIEQSAMDVMILDDNDYVMAVEVTKTVKQAQKKVKDYWEPLRISAKKTYDDVLSHKKEMMTPLEKAEAILKRKMADYDMKKELERREAEEKMKMLAQQEVDRKLEEAALAESAGDTVAAEYAMAAAEMMDGLTAVAPVKTEAVKAKGVTRKRSWEITSIDSSKVPIEIAGAVIRPVDEKAIMALIKATKGEIKIPGVEYKATVNVSVRA